MEDIIRLVDSCGKIGKIVVMAVLGAFTVSVVVHLLVALNLIDITTIEGIFNISTDADVVKALLDFVLNAFR